MPVHGGRVISMRLSETEIEAVGAAADRLGMSRSEYLRMLIRLPISFECVGRKDARTLGIDAVTLRDGVLETVSRESLDTPSREGGGGGPRANQGSPKGRERTGLLLTDKPLHDIRVAIDRWGANYNQAVRTLNSILRRFGRIARDDEDAWGELLAEIRGAAVNNERAYRGLEHVHADFQQLLGMERVDMRSEASREADEVMAGKRKRRRRKRKRADGGAGLVEE